MNYLIVFLAALALSHGAIAAETKKDEPKKEPAKAEVKKEEPKKDDSKADKPKVKPIGKDGKPVDVKKPAETTKK